MAKVENVQPGTKVGFLEELCKGTMPSLGVGGGRGGGGGGNEVISKNTFLYIGPMKLTDFFSK